MDPLELGKFVGETTTRCDALDRRISEQGKSLRTDMTAIRDEVIDLRRLVESRLNGRGKNNYKEKLMYGGGGGGLVIMAELVRRLVS